MLMGMMYENVICVAIIEEGGERKESWIEQFQTTIESNLLLGRLGGSVG